MFHVEKVNLQLNQSVGDGCNDINHVAQTVLTMNSTDPVKHQINELFKISEEIKDYYGAQDKNVAAIKQLLRDRIGSTREQVCRRKVANGLHTDMAAIERRHSARGRNATGGRPRRQQPVVDNGGEGEEVLHGYDKFTWHRVNSNWEWKCEEMCREMAVLHA